MKKNPAQVLEENRIRKEAQAAARELVRVKLIEVGRDVRRASLWKVRSTPSGEILKAYIRWSESGRCGTVSVPFAPG